MHEIFFICACIGYRKNQKTPLDRNSEDRFWSSTIIPEEYASYYAMLIEANDMDFTVIADDKTVISTIEEYANAGMNVLIEDVLGEYTLSRGDDLRIDPSCSKELPKVLLAYVYEKAYD
jgi:hypothetical protein